MPRHARTGLAVLGLTLSLFTATASAGILNTVPEMDAGTMTTALTVLSGGILLVMGRRRAK